jgi:isopentenyl diphosphate isomerase/L-lactate dehydrogenase-like FMN-dependent dehydrogenase
LTALPGIAEAVGDRLTVIVDSGVRRGSDIVKCLALGARAVMVGRPMLYGVGAGGEAGAAKALSILRSELRRTLAYVGCSTIDRLGQDLLESLPGVEANRGSRQLFAGFSVRR